MRRLQKIGSMALLAAWSACAQTRPLTPAPQDGALDALPARIQLAAAGSPLCGYALGKKSTGTTFVYLHGGPGYRSADFVRFTAPRLARVGRVVAFDQRGAGCSPRAEARFTIADQVEDVAALVRGLGTGRVVLIGHSYGGILAAHVALAHPELLTSLVLLDAPLDVEHALAVLLDRCAARADAEGRADDAAGLRNAHRVPALLDRVVAIAAHGHGCTAALLVPPGHVPTEVDVQRLDTRDGYNGDELHNDGRLAQAAFAAWPATLALPAGALDHLPVPVTAIWGADDPYYPDPASSALRTVIIAGAGHHSYREEPARVAEAIIAAGSR